MDPLLAQVVVAAVGKGLALCSSSGYGTGETLGEIHCGDISMDPNRKLL